MLCPHNFRGTKKIHAQKKNEKWTHAERETYLLPPPQVIICSLTTLECHFSSSYLKLNWVEYYSILLPCNFTCKPNDLCAQGNVQSKILQPTLVDVGLGHYIFLGGFIYFKENFVHPQVSTRTQKLNAKDIMCACRCLEETSTGKCPSCVRMGPSSIKNCSSVIGGKKCTVSLVP